ncbi:MAG: hypothetical protein KJ592_02055 [Nanoarchaeota archaeon]|nr:hypothetical protein [Nanoarchaeota archaeon]
MELFKVNTKLMGKGLEEALKFQLNFISEAVDKGLDYKYEDRCNDFETLRNVSHTVQIDTEQYTEQFNQLQINYRNIRWKV